VLRVPAFRRLWVALSLSSLGDWLGLLATTALATTLADSYAAKNFAFGGVLVFRLLPALLLGPLAGVFADRFDRRRTMVVCDLLRFALFASIPLVGSLTWLFIASFLIEAVSLFWIPAKEASVPNLLPREQLEAANQLSLITTYGSAPVAGAVFSLLALLSQALGSSVPFFSTNPVDLALYFNASTFLFSALTIARLPEVSGARGRDRVAQDRVGVFRSVLEGWRFVGKTPLIRGLVTGMIGGVAAAGAIVGTGKTYALSLGGGDATFGVLFGAVFLGLALGMGMGPRLLDGLSRRRLFGLMVVGAGGSLSGMALVPNSVFAVLGTLAVGAFAGAGWVIGQTLFGSEVADSLRGRTFAFVQSLMRVVLLVSVPAAAFLAGVIGQHTLEVASVEVGVSGVRLLLFFAGLLSVVTGLIAYRQMDDRFVDGRRVPLRRDLLAALRGHLRHADRGHPGLLVAFEGGEGAGKSTQVRLLADWLRGQGHSVETTVEPGGTPLGARLRAVLLDPGTVVPPRAEALLYAADRADHVASTVRPALQRGAIVLTDRYVDSSVAYQGAGRSLPAAEVAKLSDWATGGLQADLTVLLDLDPAVGLARAAGRSTADRLEAESLPFHQRVRAAFLSLAAAAPHRYLVVDAAQPAEQVAEQIRERVAALLDTPVPAEQAARMSQQPVPSQSASPPPLSSLPLPPPPLSPPAPPVAVPSPTRTPSAPASAPGTRLPGTSTPTTSTPAARSNRSRERPQ